MELQRMAFLQNEISNHLELGSKPQVVRVRLLWLVSRLEIYLNRWVGWLEYLDSVNEIKESEFHTLLLITLRNIEDELKGLTDSSDFEDLFDEFVSSVGSIDNDTKKDISMSLMKKAQEMDLLLRLKCSEWMNDLERQ